MNIVTLHSCLMHDVFRYVPKQLITFWIPEFPCPWIIILVVPEFLLLDTLSYDDVCFENWLWNSVWKGPWKFSDWNGWLWGAKFGSWTRLVSMRSSESQSSSKSFFVVDSGSLSICEFECVIVIWVAVSVLDDSVWTVEALEGTVGSVAMTSVSERTVVLVAPVVEGVPWVDGDCTSYSASYSYGSYDSVHVEILSSDLPDLSNLNAHFYTRLYPRWNI